MMYVLATTNMGEVLKVPMFVEHFMEYEGNLSEFVMEHYDNHKKDADWDLDQSYHLSIHLSYLLYMLSFLIIPLRSKNLRKSEFPKTVFTRKRFLNLYLSSIFQPPRLS
jgi:hypothetical protein